MPIIATPVADPLAPCDELAAVSPVESMLENCPVLDKLRAAIIEKGVTASIQWEMRDRSGQPIDLSSCLVDCDSESSDLNPCRTLKARFSDHVTGGCTIYEVSASVVDVNAGTVQVNVPAEIRDYAGIYSMSIALVDEDDVPVLVNTGFLSVERGMWGQTNQVTGPPTINEIRLALRDTSVENDLLDAVEFSDSEIAFAISRPLQEFNESSPDLNYRFNGKNFPYREHWLRAISAQLLKTAAHWYRRNKLNSAHGGLQLADRDRDREYLLVAQALDQEWRDFMLRKKAELNAQQAYGSIGSPYTRDW